MFLFVTAIILVLSFGGVVFIMARKIPALIALPEDIPAPPNLKKVLISKAKNIKLSRGKELFNASNYKKEEITEDKIARKESFDQDSDYWNKIIKK